MKKSARLLLLASLVFSVLAWAGPQERIKELKENPQGIFRALADGQEAAPVRDYFHKLFASPRSLRDALKDDSNPLGFKVYLVDSIARWVRTNSLPNQQETRQGYVLAMLAAFRDASPEATVRDAAYYRFSSVVAALEGPERNSVLASLHQLQIQADARLVVLPALILIEPVDTSIKRLQALSAEDSETQLRVFEALAREKKQAKKERLDVQRTVVPFVSSKDEKVRIAAARVLYDPRNSVLAARDRLFQEPLATLAETFLDKKATPHSQILIAQILGANLETTFFNPGDVSSEKPSLRALTQGLFNSDKGVRAASAAAFEKIKTPDSDSQKALASVVIHEKEAGIALDCYRALGGQHKHVGDHRIRDEAVKQVLTTGLLRLAQAKPQNAERIEWVLVLLRRNPPGDLSTVNQLCEAHALLKEESARVRVLEILTNAKVDGNLPETQAAVASTVALLGQASTAHPMTEALSEILKKAGLPVETIGQFLASENPAVRKLGGDLFEALPASKFTRSVENVELAKGLESALQRGGKSHDSALRKKIFAKLRLHAGSSPIRSESVWRGVTANLVSADPDIRATAADLVLVQCRIRGRERWLPFADQVLVRTMTRSSQGNDRAAEAAQLVLELLRSRGCPEAVAAEAMP